MAKIPLPATPRPERVPVAVSLIRPDGTSREIAVVGHYREDHLSTVIDDELCRLASSETLVVRLHCPDEELSDSIRQRWEEGTSDSRRISVREVLGPTENSNDLALQLQRIRKRLRRGEQIKLAIRSAAVAKMVRGQLDSLLAPVDDEPAPLSLWVYGSDEVQQQIVAELGERMSRLEDLTTTSRRSRRQFWREPLDEAAADHDSREKKKRSGGSVDRWIRKVEKGRQST